MASPLNFKETPNLLELVGTSVGLFGEPSIRGHEAGGNFPSGLIDLSLCADESPPSR
jgi:hypothetical protein